MELTDEQKKFAEHPDAAFVEACPGAGKTRTVLARLEHLARSMPLRRGVAVLSFTNKAIEEFKERSGPAGVSHMIRFPGYIGTFDGFVRHFLFGPASAGDGTKRPQVVESWDALEIEIRLSGSRAFAGPGVSLDLFDAHTHIVDPNRISHGGLRAHVSRFKNDYERTARQRRLGLNQAGYFSTQDIRAIVSERIRDAEWGTALGKALTGRFQEIVVDEAQDCNPSDLEILTWLQSHGTPVTLVCDMNQSIYAFRHGEKVHLERFAETYPNKDRLSLTGNFRSTPAICSLSASMRAIPTQDVAMGPNASLQHPVLLYPYSGRTVSTSIGEWFATVATSDRFGLMRENLIVLAHAERSARMASGNTPLPVQGVSKVERFARALNEFWTGTT